VTAADGRSFFYLGGSPENPIPEGFFGCLPTAGGCLPSDPVSAPVRVTFKGLATGDLGLEPGTLGNSPCKDVSDEHKFGRHCADGVGHFSSTDGTFPAEPEDTDTIVQRQADLVFGAVGDVRSAPIELVSLSLHSIEPIEISYGGGRAFQRFDVIVTGPRVKGRTGTMVVSRTGKSSGTYASRLPMDLDFVGAKVAWEALDERR
jgi:hypothetical protein